MNQQDKGQVTEMLAIQYEMNGQVASERVITYMLKQLDPYGFEPVMTALDKLGKESSFKINLAEIIKRIDDGRPSAQLAWSQCPMNEEDSAVLTEDQREALSCVSHLLYCGDPIPARMAFIEKYNTLVEIARANAVPVKYVLSAGINAQMRIDVAKAAVEDGRLLKSRACWMLNHTADDEILALESPMESVAQIAHQAQSSGNQSHGAMQRAQDLAKGMRLVQ